MQEMQLAQMPVAVNGKVHLVPSTEVEAKNVSLRAVQPEDIPLVWGWLNEYPSANFDDYGPRTMEALESQIVERMQNREYITIATLNGKPVGIIGYRLINDRLGEMRGICFAKEVHDTGVCHFAIKSFIKIVMHSGKLQKIRAHHFQDNSHVKRFLRAIGFVHEGTLLAETVRGGKPINVSVSALYRKTWEAM